MALRRGWERQNITAIVTVIAEGQATKQALLWITQKKRGDMFLRAQCPATPKGMPDGWSSQEVFLEWVGTVLVKKNQPLSNPHKCILLLVDGSKTHVTLEGLQKMQVGRYVGALGRGEAPHGSRWRCCCDEQEEAPRLKREDGLHPARPACWPPTKQPRAALGGLIAARVPHWSRQEGVPPCWRTSAPLGGTLGVHRISWRIPFPRHASGAFLVPEFRGAWVSQAPP